MIQKLGRASLIRLAFGVLVALVGLILQHPLAALAVLLVCALPFAFRFLQQAHETKRARKQALIDFASTLAKQRQFERIAAGTPPPLAAQQSTSMAAQAPLTSEPAAAQSTVITPPPSPQAQLQQYDFDFSDTPSAIATTPEDQLEWHAPAQKDPISVRPRSNPQKKHYFDTETAVDFGELSGEPEAVAESSGAKRIIGSRDGYTIVEHLDAEATQRFALMHEQDCLFQGDYASTRAALNNALNRV